MYFITFVITSYSVEKVRVTRFAWRTYSVTGHTSVCRIAKLRWLTDGNLKHFTDFQVSLKVLILFISYFCLPSISGSSQSKSPM